MNQTGRSPAGRLRNFAAMGDAKFQAVYDAVMAENNDREAMDKLLMVARAKSYIATRQDWGAQVAPADIDQDVWDTLLALSA